MKVSFDGIRISATNDMNALGDEISSLMDDISNDEFVSKDRLGDLAEKFNNAAQSVAVFNYIHSDDFDDLPDLKIKRIELNQGANHAD